VKTVKSAESKAVADPGAFFADALKTNMAAHGITVVGQVRRRDQLPAGWTIEPGGVPVANVVSVHVTSMRDVLWRINKSSQNLFAEAMMKYQGRAYAAEHGRSGEKGSWQNGAEAVRAFLRRERIDESGYTFIDGSGLDRGNRVTTRGQTDLLAAMSRHRYAAAFGQSLAAAGRDGTVGKRMNDLAGRVFAKTGYIGGVRALSGYVRTTRDQWLAFSIIYNKIPGDVNPYEALQDEACRLLVNGSTQ
jgi:D-alanyl-D-alanine carboxypeptidase/D-alanyl-D-alanine-endopeptidase (penicillin-binding protein 4)